VRLVCDEGVDRQIVERLRAGEHEVVYIAEVAQGAADEEVLRRAAQEKALLLTTDKDFGELVFRQQRSPHGVVLLHLAGLSQERKAAAVATVLARYGHELEMAFAVIQPGIVRIRPLRHGD
jgi:predicted nuclease of predicted toxin-antitoxin system